MKKINNKRKFLTAAMAALVVTVSALSAFAVGSYLTTFNSTYGTTGTKLNTCNLCHPGGDTGQLNLYGSAYAANGHNFAAIESLDSDGDGFTNGEEIAARTFPGDASDFPNAPPPLGDVTCIPGEGTIGTEVVCQGPDFGEKKGKVVLGGAFAKVLENGWTKNTISVVVKKVASVGPHDVTIYRQPYSSVAPINLPDAFTVSGPQIDSISPDPGSPTSEVVVSGRFFSSKKPKIYLEDTTTGKKKSCKITSWFMDPATGDSWAKFVVPKLSKTFVPGTYRLHIMNKVGSDNAPFTVGP